VRATLERLEVAFARHLIDPSTWRKRSGQRPREFEASGSLRGAFDFPAASTLELRYGEPSSRRILG